LSSNLPKTNRKNVQLVKLLGQLRDHIDIHRIIGLNVDAIRGRAMGGALLGYLQKSAHESLAIYICKIYESSARNDLNSIPGIIASLAGATQIIQKALWRRTVFDRLGELGKL